MSERSLRELLHDAMAGDEPPVRQQLLGSAVRAAQEVYAASRAEKPALVTA